MQGQSARPQGRPFRWLFLGGCTLLLLLGIALTGLFFAHPSAKLFQSTGSPRMFRFRTCETN